MRERGRGDAKVPAGCLDAQRRRRRSAEPAHVRLVSATGGPPGDIDRGISQSFGRRELPSTYSRKSRPTSARSTLATPASASMRLVRCHVPSERYHARWRRTAWLGTKAMEEAEPASSRRQGRRRPETLEEADSASSDGRADSGPIMSALAGTANETLTARAGQVGSRHDREEAESISSRRTS